MTRTSKDKIRKENSRMCSVSSNAVKIEATDPNHSRPQLYSSSYYTEQRKDQSHQQEPRIEDLSTDCQRHMDAANSRAVSLTHKPKD